jgi:NitT/TauT family transport system substrate-binding protein
MGIIPVLQALPVYVAKEKGLFGPELDAEAIEFAGAAEKDIALSSGALDGCFADLITPIVMRGNGRDIMIAAVNYDTRQDRRMFGLLAKPGSARKSPADLSEVPVGISSNSVAHLVTERLAVAAGVPVEKLQYVETKNIGLRMQMLLSGQLEAALLPEPLVTVAMAKGAVLLGDDAGFDTSQTVFAFNGKFLGNPDGARAAEAFLAAMNRTAQYIAEHPAEARAVAAQRIRLPEDLRDTYPLPKFTSLKAPDRSAVETVIKWLYTRKVIPTELQYDQVVNARLLPAVGESQPNK